jgi:hypothetical protein
MSDLLAPRKPLPLLLTGTAYYASELVSIQYFGSVSGVDNTPILRLDLKNETTLDLPATDNELKILMKKLISAYPVEAQEFLKKQPWFSAWVNSVKGGSDDKA